MISSMSQEQRSMYLEADRRDAELFSLYARAKLTQRGWLMILSGLAGFNRNVTERG